MKQNIVQLTNSSLKSWNKTGTSQVDAPLNSKWTRKFSDPSKNLLLKLKVFCAKSPVGVWLRHTGSGLCVKTLHASCLNCISACFKTCLGRFDPTLVPVEIGKTNNLHSLFHFLVPFWFLRHQVNIPWKGVQCYVISSENQIQEFFPPYDQLVPSEVCRN